MHLNIVVLLWIRFPQTSKVVVRETRGILRLNAMVCAVELDLPKRTVCVTPALNSTSLSLENPALAKTFLSGALETKSLSPLTLRRVSICWVGVGIVRSQPKSGRTARTSS
jgi:hypothetical protein